MIAAAAASGCRPVVCFGGGTFEGVSVRKDGLTPGWASDVYAYDDNPFAGCSEIGAIVYGDGPTDGSIFTNFETVGTAG